MISIEDMQKLDFAIAQLRHAFCQLFKGDIINQREFALELIGPVIENLEEVSDTIRDG